MRFLVRPRAVLRTVIACAVIALSAAVAAAAPPQEQAARVLTPEDVAAIQTVGQVAISPDGQMIAYTRSVPRRPGVDPDGGAWSELRVVAFDGSFDRGFVTGKVNVGQVRWSPDGSLLTYLARRDGDSTTAVWAISPTGGESFALVRHETSIATFEWSPDGSAIAFIAGEATASDLVSLRGKGFTQEIYEEDRPQRHAFVAEIDAAMQAGETRRLEGLPGNPYGLAWSPDGDRLVFDPAPTPLVDDQYMSKRLHLVEPGAGEVQGLIENPGKLGQFGWSPDNGALIMISAADINDPLEGRLMAISPGTEVMQDLLPGLMGHVASFDFLPDGTVVYLANVGVGTRVGRIMHDGTDGRTVFASDEQIVEAISVSSDGTRMAMVVETPTAPREVYAMEMGAEPTRLTDSNPWLADVTLAPQRPVSWTARDGLEIQGLLIEPLGRADGERVPLIMVAHGGPESHYKNGWLTGYSSPGQMAAGLGYAVFYPNYRGSTGRGVEFAKADQGDGMGGEFEDNLDGIDWLIEQGLVDGDRVGVTGGSYGGYTTAWASTRYSERFAAGVMFVGISNQLSKTGTSDIPREMELVHWLDNPYNNPELFLERSPIMYVNQAQTPLLILHGKEDPRVDPGQSYELYRAIKMQTETPVRLVLYPGEGHGNRRAASRYDYSLRMLRWFDHFLMNPGTELPDRNLDYGLEQ
jgi:dipeptidyl aminopeptidase/acylaminoacyl peptidase